MAPLERQTRAHAGRPVPTPQKTTAHYRHELQTWITDMHFIHASAHYRHALQTCTSSLQTCTTDMHYRHASAHYRHALQSCTTDMHYRHAPAHYRHALQTCSTDMHQLTIDMQYRHAPAEVWASLLCFKEMFNVLRMLGASLLYWSYTKITLQQWSMV